MLTFNDNLKIYLFKEKQTVSISIKVSDNCVNSYNVSVHDFEKLLDTWNKPSGFDGMLGQAWWNVCYKKTTSRPECASASYVKISITMHNLNFHYRVSYQDMYNMQKDYFYQKNNQMYWDNNV